MLTFISPQLATRVALRLFCTPRSRGKIVKPQLDDETIPFKISPFTYNGKRVQVYRYGKSDKKVLLVHGWEGNAMDFKKFIPALLANGYEVIAFDHPAHGNSEGSYVTAADVGEIIYNLNFLYGKFHKIIGHSFGGFAAARAAKIYTGVAPDSIVTIGSPDSLEVMLDQYAKVVGLDQKVLDGLKDLMERRFDFDMEDMATSKFLEHTKAKKLIVHDLYDRQVPFERAISIADKSENATLHQTIGQGHNRILRNQDTIEAILEFLGEQEQRSIA